MLSSLRVRLLVLVLVAVVPTVAIVVLSAREQRRLRAADAARATTALAHLVGERHQRSVDAVRGLLLGMSRMRTILERNGPACDAALAPLLAREPIFVNMGALDARGRLFCSAAQPAPPLDLSDRAFYREALRTGSLGVGEWVVSRVRGTGALGFGYPVVGKDGEVVAVAYASLAVGELQRELESLELPAGAEVTVLDRRGVILSALPPAAGRVGHPVAPQLLETMRGAGGPVALAGSDGVPRLFDLHEVTARDGTVAMHVIAGLPTGALLEPVERVSGRALLASLLASALALAVAGLMAEFMLVRRLRGLAAASRRIAAGDWSARSGLRRGRDELGDLVASFDDMARSLERLDREKRTREEQLRQAQKMEAVGRLAGGIAHDFNNVLTVVLSAASALRERLPPDHPGHEEVGEILESGARAAALTRQLLAFSRQQPLAPRSFALGDTARRMERMLGRLLGERIALHVDVRAPGHVRADAAQLELALMNLVVNARDAMPSGGRLVVEVDELPPGDPRRPAGDDVPPGPLAVIAVRDSGAGIRDDIRDRIFEPFFTTKDAAGGTGLGLSTVLGIVQQSGGAIRVESRAGHGAEFRIYLPLVAGAPDEPERLPREGRVQGSGTVLIVEDDEQLRGVVRRSLAAHGFAVVEAAGAAAAIAVARGLPAAPDLLLTDVILADGNGVDVAREVAAVWPGLPVVFMSGYTGGHLAALEASPRGARFVPKPFTPEVLLAEVRAELASSARSTASSREGGGATSASR